MKLLFVFWFICSALGFSTAAHAASPSLQCGRLFTAAKSKDEPIKIPQHLEWYEALRVLNLKPTKDITGFVSEQGTVVTQRNKNNNEAVEVVIKVLSDNPGNKIEVIGDFNNWGKNGTVVLSPDKNGTYFSGIISGIKHLDQYRLRVNGKDLLDPAALVFSTPEFNQKTTGRNSTELNSVFWDIEGAGKYHPANPITDLRLKSMSITETELHALVAKYKSGPKDYSETYNYIADSGVINELKNRGINAVEFLPFNAAADGDHWHNRYQVFGAFAIESKYGTPVEFARMVDRFNEAGIAVIMDVLLSHYPFKSNTGNRKLEPIGLSQWKKADGKNLYGDKLTQWDTYRYDYENPFVRRFLIDSVLSAIKYFRVGGLRIDNYDGIRFLPGGTQFLKELAGEVRAYAPQIWINAEMFLPENSVTKRLDWDGHGMNAYNNGNFFWNIVRSFAQSSTEGLDMSVFKWTIRDVWKWNEALKLFYATNHDEAANHTEGASGAYFATLVNGGGWQFVEGKTRAFASLAMLTGSYYLDMLQLRLLQEGTFSNNPNVDWNLLNNQSQKNSDKFFADLSRYFTNESAFSVLNLHSNIENHVDFNNKIISLERIDFSTGKSVYVLINFNHNGFENYSFGVNKAGQYKVKIDSDSSNYGGSNRMGNATKETTISSANNPMHGENQSVKVPYIAPYGVVIIEN